MQRKIEIDHILTFAMQRDTSAVEGVHKLKHSAMQRLASYCEPGLIFTSGVCTYVESLGPHLFLYLQRELGLLKGAPGVADPERTGILSAVSDWLSLINIRTCTCVCALQVLVHACTCTYVCVHAHVYMHAGTYM